MLRKISVGFGVIVGLVLGLWGVLYLTAKPVTKQEAQAIAIEQLKRSGKQLRFDPGIFRGPEPFEMGGVPYAFQWTFSDSEGPIRMIVWVDEYGGSELTWEGDVERLRKRR
jgi:hypothetical protein